MPACALTTSPSISVWFPWKMKTSQKASSLLPDGCPLLPVPLFPSPSLLCALGPGLLDKAGWLVTPRKAQCDSRGLVRFLVGTMVSGTSRSCSGAVGAFPGRGAFPAALKAALSSRAHPWPWFHSQPWPGGGSKRGRASVALRRCVYRWN